MALSVTLVSSTPLSYRLQAEKYEHRLERSPIAAPLTGGSSPILVDLGPIKHTIVIEGTLRSAAGTDLVANDIPSKRNLEDFARTEGSANIDIAITIASVTDTYRGKIKSLVFTLPAAQNDLWAFRLELVTQNRT